VPVFIVVIGNARLRRRGTADWKLACDEASPKKHAAGIADLVDAVVEADALSRRTNPTLYRLIILIIPNLLTPNNRRPNMIQTIPSIPRLPQSG